MRVFTLSCVNSKDSNLRSKLKSKFKSKGLYLRASRGVVGEPVAAEPVAAPVPPAAMPVEVTDKEEAVRVAVNGSPEENEFPLPVFRDQLGVGQEVVQNASVQDRLVGEFLPEIVAMDRACFLLFNQKQGYFGRIPLQLAGFVVFFHCPATWNVWVSGAADEVANQLNLGIPSNHCQNLRQLLAGTQSGYIVGRIPGNFQRICQLIHLTNRIYGRHSPPP